MLSGTFSKKSLLLPRRERTLFPVSRLRTTISLLLAHLSPLAIVYFLLFSVPPLQQTWGKTEYISVRDSNSLILQDGVHMDLFDMNGWRAVEG